MNRTCIYRGNVPFHLLYRIVYVGFCQFQQIIIYHQLEFGSQYVVLSNNHIHQPTMVHRDKTPRNEYLYNLLLLFPWFATDLKYKKVGWKHVLEAEQKIPSIFFISHSLTRLTYTSFINHINHYLRFSF